MFFFLFFFELKGDVKIKDDLQMTTSQILGVEPNFVCIIVAKVVRTVRLDLVFALAKKSWLRSRLLP